MGWTEELIGIVYTVAAVLSAIALVILAFRKHDKEKLFVNQVAAREAALAEEEKEEWEYEEETEEAEEGEKVVALEEVKYFQANGLLGSYRRKLAAVVPEDEESDQVIALRKQLFQLELLFFNYDLFVRSLRNGSNPIKDTAVSDKILAVYHNIFNTGADFSMPRVLEQMTDVTDDAGTHSNIEEFLMILKLKKILKLKFQALDTL